MLVTLIYIRINVACSVISAKGKSCKIFDIIVRTKSVFQVSIWGVVGQISQTGNMTFTRGISRVLASVGLSALITVTVFISTYSVLTNFTCQKQSLLYTAVRVLSPPSLHWNLILSCNQFGAYGGISPSPHRSQLALSQNRCTQFCVMAERVKHVVMCRGSERQKQPLNSARLAESLLATDKAINWRYVTPPQCGT